MNWLRNLPVQRKFALTFGVVCGLCLLLGTYTFLTFRGIAARSADVGESGFPGVIDLADAKGEMDLVRREDLSLLLCKTQACVADHRAARQKAMEEYQKAIKEYEPTINYPGERELYEKFAASFAQYLESSSRGVDLLAAGKAGAADGAHVDSQKVT